MRKSEGLPLIGWGKSFNGVNQFHHQVKFAAAGENHLIYITSNNELYGLGSNKFGQLGTGNTTYYQKPQRLTNVELSCSTKIKNVFCGAQHTFFINQKHEIFSVGLNIKGQLGLGHFETIKQPKIVVSLLPNGKKNKKCLNPSIVKQPKPPIIDVLQRFDLQVKMDQQTLQNILMLNDQQSIQIISCGALFTLALSNQGRVFGCGFQGTNIGFQSSDDFLEKSKFRQIQLNTKIVSISAGLSGASALSADGKAYIWGKFGKKNNNLPKIIQFEEKLTENKIVQILVGDQFAILLTSRGEVLSYGYNIDNQLGVESKDEAYREKAILIPKLPFCNKIYIGRNSCFAISVQKNQVFGWGSNRFGQITLRENQPLIMNPKSLQFCLDKEKQQRLIPSSFCTYALCFTKIQFTQKKLFNPVQEQEEQQMVKFSEYRKLLNDYQTLKALNLTLLQKMQPKRKENKQVQTSSKFQVSGITKHRKFDSNLEIQWKQLNIQQKINQGGYGIIYRAKWRQTTVAVKKFKIQNGDVSLRDFLSECHAMEAVRHPNIVLFLGAVSKSPNYCIVLEYCQKGSLWNYLQNTDIPLPWEQRRRIAIQIARGTLYLHLCEPPILHRDLKSLNIFLDSNYRIKIGDFGWTKTLEEYMTNKIGTYQWMAPQVIGNQPYTQKADVFSYSIILWQIASREPPYRNISGTKVSEGVLNNQLRPNIPKKTPQPFAKLMKKCWQRDPNNRPNFREIIKQLEIMKL